MLCVKKQTNKQKTILAQVSQTKNFLILGGFKTLFDDLTRT